MPDCVLHTAFCLLALLTSQIILWDDKPNGHDQHSSLREIAVLTHSAAVELGRHVVSRIFASCLATLRLLIGISGSVAAGACSELTRHWLVPSFQQKPS